MNIDVLYAVWKRNFFSYFANPIGYLFICAFVLSSSFFAFWTERFFNNNLANLDQLNLWFPLIMLFFVPAITMSIWAQERQQGTDELLLTIPGSDFDVVLGKYLAAVTIYSVSLLFSLVCNLAVLVWLGSPDPGLILSTYVGYWLMGAAMLSVGMVASFLTRNLTIAFILGALFNLPLVYTLWSLITYVPAGVIRGLHLVLAAIGLPTATLQSWYEALLGAAPRWSRALESLAIPAWFADFGRGIVSLSGVLYFAGIAVVMLYLSMALISRRHWQTGWKQGVMMGHYLLRAACMGVIGFCLVLICARHDLRPDVTAERLNSLAPKTRALLAALEPQRPVLIEAFVSPEVPESYVPTRLNLLSMLREIAARGGSKVRVNIIDTEVFSAEAERAEKRYGIEAREVVTLDRGVYRPAQIFMGVAFTCGLQKVIVPFIDRGIPVEYELVRSLAVVAQQERRRLGVVRTDAPLYGRFNMQTMSASSNWPIIAELEKQYEVEQVDPSQPIADDFDVLLVVQPSSLGPAEMENLIAAIERGIPTAIFEDPLPIFEAEVPPTSMPRRPPGGFSPFMAQPPPEKGDISQLWNLLGVDFAAQQIVWQDYNPFPRISFEWEFVFVDRELKPGTPFNPDHAVSAGLDRVLFPFPGAITRRHVSPLQYTALVRTGERTGTVRFSEILEMGPFGMGGRLNPSRRQIPTNAIYELAAHIHGTIKPPPESAASDAKGADSPDASQPGGNPAAAAKPAEKKINVILVSDVDLLTPGFFRLREQGDIPESDIRFDFDNVNFVLNVLDFLAGDESFIELRGREPKHRTLTRVDEVTAQAREKAIKQRDQFIKDFEAAEQREEDALRKKIDELRNRQNIDPQQMILEVAMAQQDGERRKQAAVQRARQEMELQLKRIDRNLKLQVDRVQNSYKLWAVVLPPIPPLVIGLIVFLMRRSAEQAGVSHRRLRSPAQTGTPPPRVGATT